MRTRALVLKLQKDDDDEVDVCGQPNADDAERCSVKGYACLKNRSLFPNGILSSPPLFPTGVAVSSLAVKVAMCPIDP